MRLDGFGSRFKIAESATPASGYGYLEPTACDGAIHPFSVDLPSVSELRFRRGVALWSASGYVEGGGGLQTVSVPPTEIRIR